MILFFFFSSRRRHTRLTCDWSSDVCSSDLLVLAGRSEGRLQLLETLARDHGIYERVRFAGDVEDVAGLLDASDVGVLCSSAEGCPNAVLEYMAAGQIGRASCRERVWGSVRG